jgi:hypothetical protein
MVLKTDLGSGSSQHVGPPKLADFQPSKGLLQDLTPLKLASLEAKIQLKA